MNPYIVHLLFKGNTNIEFKFPRTALALAVMYQPTVSTEAIYYY